jgi:hypothetical protein
MPATTGEQANGSGRPRRRSGKISGVIRVAIFVVAGVVLLGLGISGLHNRDVLVAHGVPAVARVSATSGYGRDTIQVTYPVRGRPTEGTIDVGTSTYKVGETLPVVYDPRSPQVVAAQGSATSSGAAWGEVGVGCFFLAVVLFAFLLSRRSASTRRAARDSPGG